MCVHRPRVAEVVEAPNLVKKLVAREHAVVVRGEEVDQLQLLGRQVDRLAADFQLVLLERNFDVLEFDQLAVGRVVLRVAAAPP